MRSTYGRTNHSHPLVLISCRYHPICMKKSAADRSLEDLRHVVSLSALAPSLHGAQRIEIDRVITELTERIGPVVPKRRAAAILNISVQALDEWIRRGRLESVRTTGAARAGIDTAELIRTAHMIPPGTARPGRVVDRAQELARRHEEFWRFNEAVALTDIREFSTLGFDEQVRQIDALNASMAAVLAMRPLTPARETTVVD